MNLLLLGEIKPDLPLPRLNLAVQAHILEKAHPNARAASCTTWHLLVQALKRLGWHDLPEVRFSPTGKPFFQGEQMHFSLSHSGNLAVALISSAPCGVDIERFQFELDERLAARCLSDAERRANLSGTLGWTRKECIVKRDSTGLRARPDQIDTLDSLYKDHFWTRELQHGQQRYILSALCANDENIQFQKILPEELV